MFDHGVKNVSHYCIQLITQSALPDGAMVDDVVVFSESLSVDATVEIEAVLATVVDDSGIIGTIKSYKYKILKTLQQRK